ncbi:hypothetical protein [Marinobacter mangrovi]|uniref:hypothetical protein n=1 Tax=Marinobacter mangrovi TaxID=2803918 RepID=UPI0019340684|nr:hypothetical protein [Marinobacter mangrovi]
MQEALNPYIHELNGYLLCLSRLAGRGYSFGAHAYVVDADVDSFVSEVVATWSKGDEYIPASEFRYVGKSIIEYGELQSEITRYVMHGLLGPGKLSEAGRSAVAGVILEDIIEYYGLASTSINPEGVFHPPIKRTVHRLDIKNENYESCLFFVLQIEDIYVLTGLCKKKI